MRWLGVLALLGTAIHWGYHLYHQRPWDLLWACHVGAALVGIGCLFDWGSCVGIGVLWLIVGLPMWILGLWTGEEFMPTSLLTHVVGLVIGAICVSQRGMATGAWWQAILALIALQQACRFVTPERANVNLVFHVPSGWESWFPSYVWYWLLMTTVFAASFFLAAWGLEAMCGTHARSSEASG